MRNQKITKAKQLEFETRWKERNKFLKSIGLGKETFEQYMEWLHGKGRKEKRQAPYEPKFSSPSQGVSKASTTRTGSGIGTTKLGDAVGTKDDIRQNRGALFPTVSNDGCVKPTILYTGTKMVGIATMHKSNSVPVFSDEEAIDIARMRR